MQPVNTPYAELVGDGSSTEIEFDFSVDIASTSPSGSQSYPRVRLITYDEDTGALESVETLTYGTDYTVSLTAKDSEAGDLAYPGGTITLTVAPEDYQTVYVDRVSPLTQSTIFPTGGQLNLRTLEAKLDYLTRIVQEQELDLSRIPVSSDPTAQPVLWYATEDDWGKYAFLDLSGNAVFVTEVETGTLTLTNQGVRRVGYGGDTDEIRFDGNFTYNEDTDTLGVVNLSVSTGITGDYLTASRVVVTNGDKKLVSAVTTATQVDYLSGTTGDVQVQLDAKLATAATTYVKVLDRKTTPAASNGTTETTLYTYTVPGGTLGARMIRVTALLMLQTDATNTNDLTLAFKWGADTVSIGYANIDDNAGSGYPVMCMFYVAPYNNTTNAQRMWAQVILKNGAITTPDVRMEYQTAAADSTADVTLSITADWSINDPADDIITLEFATMELI